MPIVNLNLTVVVNKRNYDSVSLRTGCLDGRTRGRADANGQSRATLETISALSLSLSSFLSP